MGKIEKHPSVFKTESIQHSLEHKNLFIIKNSHSNHKKYELIQESHCIEIPFLKDLAKNVFWENKEYRFSFPYIQFRKKSLYQIEEPKNYESILFFFDHCFLEDFFDRNFYTEMYQVSEGNEIEPVFTFETAKDFHILAQKMIISLTNKEKFSPCMASSFFDQLFFTVLNSKRSKEFMQFLLSLKAEKNFDLKFFMEKNYLKSLSNQELANLCFKSLSSFLKEFKQVFKTSPQKWMLKKRLEKAKLVLKKSDKNISELCFELGFKDLSHFSKVFKKEFGESPLEYKKKS